MVTFYPSPSTVSGGGGGGGGGGNNLVYVSNQDGADASDRFANAIANTGEGDTIINDEQDNIGGIHTVRQRTIYFNQVIGEGQLTGHLTCTAGCQISGLSLDYSGDLTVYDSNTVVNSNNIGNLFVEGGNNIVSNCHFNEILLNGYSNIVTGNVAMAGITDNGSNVVSNNL